MNVFCASCSNLLCACGWRKSDAPKLYKIRPVYAVILKRREGNSVSASTSTSHSHGASREILKSVDELTVELLETHEIVGLNLVAPFYRLHPKLVQEKFQIFGTGSTFKCNLTMKRGQIVSFQ